LVNWAFAMPGADTSNRINIFRAFMKNLVYK
jgi:hypothetical protein